jgi:predicted amino acid-binding ACT domain protein
MLYKLVKALKEKQVNIINISSLLCIDCIMFMYFIQEQVTSSYEQVITLCSRKDT